MRFIFSSGEFIDSLEVRRKGTDALAREPAAYVLLMLYDNLSDTIVRTERPFYFAKTGEDGQYKIGNIKSDTFKVFALFDSNLNYRYDQESELIGFPEENIVLGGDSSMILPTISVFQENPPLKIISKKPQSGVVKLTFNQKPEELNFKTEAAIENVSYEYDQDTVNVWYDWEKEGKWELFVNKDTVLFDTIDVKMVDKKTFLSKRKLKILGSRRKNKIDKFNPAEVISIKLNHPIASYDSTKVYFFEDSTFTPIYPEINIEQRELKLKYRWKEDSLYQNTIIFRNQMDHITFQTI